MFGNPYTLFVLELCKHCGEPSPSSSQVGTHPIIDDAAAGSPVADMVDAAAKHKHNNKNTKHQRKTASCFISCFFS